MLGGLCYYVVRRVMIAPLNQTPSNRRDNNVVMYSRHSRSNDTFGTCSLKLLFCELWIVFTGWRLHLPDPRVPFLNEFIIFLYKGFGP